MLLLMLSETTFSSFFGRDIFLPNFLKMLPNFGDEEGRSEGSLTVDRLFSLLCTFQQTADNHSRSYSVIESLKQWLLLGSLLTRTLRCYFMNDGKEMVW